MAGRGFSLHIDLENGFAQRLELEYDPGAEVCLPAPTKEEIKELTQASLWASLTREEGQLHRFNLSFVPSDYSTESIIFKRPLPFNPENLAKIAPALRSSTSFGVWRQEAGAAMYIWGLVSPDRGDHLTIEAVAAGEIVISLPWGPKAVVTPTIGTRFIDSNKALLLHGNELDGDSTVRKRVFAKESDFKTVARVMRQHGSGGTLLVVPKNEHWRSSIQTDRFSFECYSYERGRTALRNREKAVREQQQDQEQAEKKGGFLVFGDEPGEWLLEKPLRDIGQLTAADGATLVTYDLVLLGFGAKIKDGNNKLEEVFVSEPFEDSKERRVSLGELGGTRHQSAAQFVFDQRDAIAIVASQDGVVSFFAWNKEENRVTVIRHAEFDL